MYDRELESARCNSRTLPLHLELRKKAAMYWLGKGSLQKVENLLDTPTISKTESKTIIMTEWQLE